MKNGHQHKMERVLNEVKLILSDVFSHLAYSGA